MPKRYATTTGTRKRAKTGARRGRRRMGRKTMRNFSPIYRPPGGVGFPRQLKMKHRYCETVNMTYNIGSPAVYRYSANNMYDPRTAAGGHQPMFFDQMCVVYNHWTVIASKITIKGTPPATAAGLASYVCLVTDDDTSELQTSITALVEDGSKKKNLRVTGGINPQPITMSLGWSAKREFGGSVLANNALQGSTSAGPTEESFFKICLESADASTTVLCYFIVEIEYIAIWKELSQMTTS